MVKPPRTRHRRPGGQVNRGSTNGQIPLNRNHVFESTGPDGRVRGAAQQLSEKYQQLGRDAQATGDRVQAEAFFQHGEHYVRTLNAINAAAQAAQAERQQRSQDNFRNRRPRHDEPRAQQQEEDEKQVEAPEEQQVQEIKEETVPASKPARTRAPRTRTARAPKVEKVAADKTEEAPARPWRPSEDAIETAE